MEQKPLKEEIEKVLIEHGYDYSGTNKNVIAEIMPLLQSHLNSVAELVEAGKNESTGIGAIPETTEYAKGWNACRKEARKAKDAAKSEDAEIIRNSLKGI